MARRKPRGRLRNSAQKNNKTSPATNNNDQSSPVLSNRGPQLADATRVRPIDELQGIAPLILSTVVGNPVPEVVTPDVSGSRALQSGARANGNRSGTPRLWSSLFPVNGHVLTNGMINDKSDGNIKITYDDIRPKVDFWLNVVVCHVLGANLPLQVMDGFVRRIWRKHGIDRIALMEKRIFIMRFNSVDGRVKVLEDGSPMFDKKSVVVIPWSPDLEAKNLDVSRMPI